MKVHSFFETVSEEVRCDHLCQFIHTTGKEATSTASCAVCASQFFCHDLSNVKLTDLRTKDKLSPAKPHPAHILTDGMLLHHSLSTFHVSADGSKSLNMCMSCASDL